jgi:hypothetical protein
MRHHQHVAIRHVGRHDGNETGSVEFRREREAFFEIMTVRVRCIGHGKISRCGRQTKIGRLMRPTL